MKVVRTFQPKDVYMGRIAHGEDIIQSLENFCIEHSIQSAWVQCMGAVSKATLSYYGQAEHRYFSQEFKGEYEIVSCTGNISLREHKPFAHLHIVLSDTRFQCYAGHLVPGSANVFACEFVIQAFDGGDPLVRERDEQTGLYLW